MFPSVPHLSLTLPPKSNVTPKIITWEFTGTAVVADEVNFGTNYEAEIAGWVNIGGSFEKSRTAEVQLIDYGNENFDCVCDGADDCRTLSD